MKEEEFFRGNSEAIVNLLVELKRVFKNRLRVLDKERQIYSQQKVERLAKKPVDVYRQDYYILNAQQRDQFIAHPTYAQH